MANNNNNNLLQWRTCRIVSTEVVPSREYIFFNRIQLHIIYIYIFADYNVLTYYYITLL